MKIDEKLSVDFEISTVSLQGNSSGVSLLSDEEIPEPCAACCCCCENLIC